ncbi:MAG: hypothetical protein LBJ41_11975 [Treponema sp.]|jgi:hypothetical protein|nr:hypothetical protein [Treponema sp.]
MTLSQAGPFHFVVLIPHRDSAQTLEPYSRKLFSAGFAGAYSFPNVAPLALVSHAYSRNDLKTLALSQRNLSARSQDGKLRALSLQTVSCPSPTLTLFGPLLDTPIPSPETFPADATLYRFPRLILCAALLGPGDEALTRQSILPELAVPPFRAAMLANMSLSPLDSGAPAYSFAWEIAESVWLPAYSAA